MAKFSRPVGERNNGSIVGKVSFLVRENFRQSSQLSGTTALFRVRKTSFTYLTFQRSQKTFYISILSAL